MTGRVVFQNLSAQHENDMKKSIINGIPKLKDNLRCTVKFLNLIKVYYFSAKKRLFSWFLINRRTNQCRKINKYFTEIFKYNFSLQCRATFDDLAKLIYLYMYFGKYWQ